MSAVVPSPNPNPNPNPRPRARARAGEIVILISSKVIYIDAVDSVK